MKTKIDNVVDDWYDGQLPEGIADEDKRFIEDDDELAEVEAIEREIMKDRLKQNNVPNTTEKY